MRHDHELAKKLYAGCSPIDRITESVKSILAAFAGLIAEPTSGNAEALKHLLRRAIDQITEFQKNFTRGPHGDGTGQTTDNTSESRELLRALIEVLRGLLHLFEACLRISK